MNATLFMLKNYDKTTPKDLLAALQVFELTEFAKIGPNFWYALVRPMMKPWYEEFLITFKDSYLLGET